MSSSSTRYTARFQLPELLERGADQVVQCPVYRAGALVQPSAGTLTVRRRSSSTPVVDAQAITVTGGIATYTVPAASLPATLSYEDGWSFEWALDMPDGETHTFRNTGALVHFRLYPTITDLDIVRRCRALDVSLAGAITDQDTFQDQIDEADVEVQLRLLQDRRRPNLVATPHALRKVWLDLTLAILFEDLASRENTYADAAKDWRERYEHAYDEATPLFDYDEDGVVDDPSEAEALSDGVIWTC